MSVDVKTKLVEGIVILQPLGNMLEAVDGENLLNETHNYLGEYSKFILDCSEIKHLNSTGINNILKVFTQIRNHGGEMILCAIPIQIEKLLIITKLNSIFSIFNTVDEGISNLKIQDV